MEPIRSRVAGCVVLVAIALFVPGSSWALADSVENFYKGKTIRITVGYTPGGSYDYYARVFAEHMGKYIPVAPTIIVRKLPGASSLVAANYLFNIAPKDGTALGVVTQTVMLEGPLGTHGVKYDASKFSYIGRMTLVLETRIGRQGSSAKTIEEARQHEMVAGVTGPTSPTEGYPRLLNAFA
jgi:tripartite-type tricarboxylate transporter receptor subunit TctC